MLRNNAVDNREILDVWGLGKVNARVADEGKASF